MPVRSVWGSGRFDQLPDCRARIAKAVPTKLGLTWSYRDRAGGYAIPNFVLGLGFAGALADGCGGFRC
jgi:hypothetical protein